MPYGIGPRHGRVDIDTASFARDGAATRDALQWHREGVQRNHLVEDTLLPQAHDGDGTVGSWWDTWEEEWDDGWDWEEKWHPVPGAAHEPRDDPRRPRGPLVVTGNGRYKSVTALSHAEVVAAVVAAHAEPPGEVIWQALCRRAEVVAVSFTPAEVHAIVRCVAERQAGQLRLLWKLAGMVVEKLQAFTADDLVSFASAYASLDAIHQGLLNVIALVFADPEDDRELTPTLAVEILTAFARAKYPLPLIIGETKRVLFNRGRIGEAQPDTTTAVAALRPDEALQALSSLTMLDALNGAVLAALLPVGLGRNAIRGDMGNTSILRAVCATCRWAVSARLHTTPELHGTQVVGGDAEHERGMSSEDALDIILGAVRSEFIERDLLHLRVVRGRPSPTCFLSMRALAAKLESTSSIAIDGDMLLAAAELLAGSVEPGDVHLASMVLEGVSCRGGAEVWPPELQVRWLGVANQCAQSEYCATRAHAFHSPAIHLPVSGVVAEGQGDVPGAVVALLTALSLQPPHQLVLHAATLLDTLPSIGSSSAACAAAVATLAGPLAAEVRQNLFRLKLREACTTTHACLRLAAQMPSSRDDASAAVQREALLLFTAVIDNLPSKFRAECVFHRRREGGVDSRDLMAWCDLLANTSLLERASAAGVATEEVWHFLAEEASQVIACGELDDTTVALLSAFVAEGRRRCWHATDSASPLGVVVSAVGTEWRRAVAYDGELEDPEHEPAPIPEAVERALRRLFTELSASAPAAAPPPRPEGGGRGAGAAEDGR